MSDSVEQAIITYLLAQPSVNNLVGSRIYPGTRLQASSLPAITVTRIAGGPLYADDGECDLNNPQLQIDCWGSTYTSAKLLAKAVLAVLSAHVGTSGTVEIQYIMLDAERDLQETGANQSEYLFRTSMDFTIWHTGLSS
jgi:hypothetical protein